MDVDLYKSITKPKKFLAVPAGLSPVVLGVRDPDFADLVAFKMHHQFNPDRIYAGVDAADIARQLEINGFAVFWE